MAKLAATVYVTDPDTHQRVMLEAGSEPEPRLAALVTNPDAWEDGKPPTPTKTAATDTENTHSDAADTKPAAKKTTARKPARGRDAADEGSSGS
ncbi:hypothetical protein [Streptomyces sp. AD55]|uniref:hypothetical protein n=1 Tax=Streptomyces sp. AD55 TaxID=3242895 RepID=UPI0035297DD8